MADERRIAMEDTKKTVEQLLHDCGVAMDRLKIEELSQEFKSISKETLQPNFWDDNRVAQTVVKRQASLQSRVEPWQKLNAEIRDVLELVNLDDTSLADDLGTQITQLQTR